MTPPNPSPATADKQILTREDILYVIKKPEHWRTASELADKLNALLAPKFAEHAKLIQTATLEIASQHDYIWQTGRCRCGKQLNDEHTDDITWDEHIRALASQDLLAQHDAQVAIRVLAKFGHGNHPHHDADSLIAKGCVICKEIAELTAKAQAKP